MKFKLLAIAFAAVVSSIFLSCQDDLSSQGSSLIKGEVTIIVDSIPTFVPAETVEYNAYDSRSITKLLGRINVPEYGKLDCSFLSQLYPATELGINDSVPESRIDSISWIFNVPRGSLTGDSLAPQQLKLYKLNRQLPTDISNSANPLDYCDPSDPSAFIGSATYTLSALHKNDSAFIKNKYVSARVTMPREKALEIVRQYRTDPAIFQWPATFAQSFPGLYVEQSFGNGCIGNISNFGLFVYYHNDKITTSKDEETEETITTVTAIKDSVCLLTSAPEVVSSNVIRLSLSDNIKNLVAEGKSVITTPGGYIVNITFPAQEILEKYQSANPVLTVISNLSMEIPATTIKNDYGLTVAPYLLMVKKSEREAFFQNNKIPDNVTSFRAAYDSEKKSYSFNSLRQYLINLINSGEEIKPEDVEFSLVPVDITIETVEQYNSVIDYVTRCSNYITKPTMTVLDTDNAIINFTYSKQELN